MRNQSHRPEYEIVLAANAGCDFHAPLLLLLLLIHPPDSALPQSTDDDDFDPYFVPRNIGYPTDLDSVPSGRGPVDSWRLDLFLP